MPEHLDPEDATSPAAEPRAEAPTPEADRARERAVASMVSASVLAVMGTLILAWALRTPDYPWLFAVGAVPWLVGIVVFARALWRYTHD